MSTWPTEEWTEVLPAVDRSGADSTGWMPLQIGLSEITVRIDSSNGGDFTTPFDAHPWNSTDQEIVYSVETSADGIDGNAANLVGATSIGSPTGSWPGRHGPLFFVSAGSGIPDSPYPGFIRVRYNITNGSPITFGMSVFPVG